MIFLNFFGRHQSFDENKTCVLFFFLFRTLETCNITTFHSSNDDKHR